MNARTSLLSLLCSTFFLFSFVYVNNDSAGESIASPMGYRFNQACQMGNGLNATYFSDTRLSKQVISEIEAGIDMNLYHRSPKAGIDGNQFSVRWSGGVYAPETGNYTFIFRVDDGARVWLDDQLLIDEWDYNEATDFEFTVQLQAGTLHKLRVDYVQFMYNDAVAQLRWITPSQPDQIIPTQYLYTCPSESCFANPADATQFKSICQKEPEATELTGLPFDPTCRTGNGLTAEYFNSSKLRKSVLKEIAPSIDFNYHRTPPRPGVRGHDFSIRYTGGLLTPTSGEYTFYFTVDDGARIWINNQLVLDQWGLNEATEFKFTAKAEANQMHQIRIEYAQFMYEDAVAKFEWETPNGERQLVPMQNLYPVPDVTCKEPIASNEPISPLEEKRKKKALKKGIVAAVVIAILTALQIRRNTTGGGE